MDRTPPVKRKVRSECTLDRGDGADVSSQTVMPAGETEIVFMRDGEEILRRQLPPGSYTIGRWQECHLHVLGDLVSRQHARLVVEEGRAFLEDLGSSNGTFINGQSITERTLLPPGVRAQMGVLTLEIPSREPTTAETLARLLPEEFIREKKYDVGPMIAQGGMGAILDAREATIRRSVAMKVMLTEGTADDLRRFIEEAQITGQLEHPNIVPVHELGLDADGKLFYTMKLVKGITLLKILQLLAQGVAETVEKYPLAELLTVFQKVCDALAFAHSKGVIHRDLKPENVMIARYGEVLVMDWGIAKLVKPVGAAKDGAKREVNVKSTFIQLPRDGGNPCATMSGAILGTPGFMSPEQARGEVDSLDARSDIFALGAILYTILTLEFPFDGTTAEEIVEKVKTAQPIPPTQRVLGTGKGGAQAVKGASGKTGKGKLHLPGGRVPEALNAITMKALARRREDRYQTVEEFQADLAAYQGGFATRAEHAGVGRQAWLLVQRNKAVAVAAAVLFVLIVAFGVTVLLSQRRMAATLAQLQSTAPTFYAQARSLVVDGKLDDALEKIAFANQLAPANADYHLFRAHTLQAAQRLAEAAAAYRHVLTLRRGDDSAQKNLALSTQLLAENGGPGPLRQEVKVRLLEQLNAQQRSVEGSAIAAQLGVVSRSAEPAIRARLREYAAQSGWSDTRLRYGPTGFILDLSRLQIGDLALLTDLPIAELKLDDASLSSLAGIEKLSVTSLDLTGTKVADLSPLRGLKIRRLTLDSTKVTDLTPLAGLPLTSLHMNGVRATDFTPLRGLPLRSFYGNNTLLTNLSLITTPALETLSLEGTRVIDLTPLTAATQLKFLSLERCAALFDIGPIALLTQLEELHLPEQSIDCALLKTLPQLTRIHLDQRTQGVIPAKTFWEETAPRFALAGPVRTALQRASTKLLPPDAVEQNDAGQLEIHISGMPISDLSALRGQPIVELRANNTSVHDLTALAGAPLRIIHLSSSGFFDCKQLTAFPTLEEIWLPTKTNFIDSLRALPNLKYVSTDWDPINRRPAKTAEEFWLTRDR